MKMVTYVAIKKRETKKERKKRQMFNVTCTSVGAALVVW
jgi:hypothetical protein